MREIGRTMPEAKNRTMGSISSATSSSESASVLVSAWHAAHDFRHGLRHEHRADDVVHERDGHGDDDELAAHDFFGGVGFGRFAAVFAQVVHDAAGLCGFVLA